MPQGYYTIEEYKSKKWRPLMVLPFGLTQTQAEDALVKHNKPGLYRLVQTQRIIWCHPRDGKLHHSKSHTSSPENLRKTEELFDQNNGVFPFEQNKAARVKQKGAQRRSPQ